VGEEQVVCGGDRVRKRRAARGVLSAAVAQEGDHPGLVVRDEALDAVAEPAGDELRVLAERLRGGALRPAAGVLERDREVPVVKRRHRLDPAPEQLVDEPVVEVEPGGVRRAAPLWQHPRPRDGEAERRQTEVAHQRHILAVAVVEVARDRAGVAVQDLAVGGGEAVPDALAAAVLRYRALDLVRGGRRTPEEVAREGRRGVRLGLYG
jgi:hypothetical protein